MSILTPQTTNTPLQQSRATGVGTQPDWFGTRRSTRIAIFHSDKFNWRTIGTDFVSTTFLLSTAQCRERRGRHRGKFILEDLRRVDRDDKLDEKK